DLTLWQERASARVTPAQHVHVTEENNVAQSIADHAGELQADMIALCTHGRSGLRRVVSGSIAQQVLRRAAAPVLLVRARTQAPARLERLLVPLDCTAASEAALDLAAVIARTCKVALNLAVVVPTVETVTGDLLPTARLT